MISLAVFGLTYLLISLQKVKGFHLDRPSGALTGALLMVLFGVVSLDEAYRLIDHNTLILLLGMMLLVAYMEIAGFFDWVSYHLIAHCHKPLSLLWGLVFASGFLSSLFVNDTICLVMTPLILKTLPRARINPVPFLIALCTSANIGSVMTLTGNPQNMLIGIRSAWSYHAYCLRMLPIGVISLLFNGLIIYFFHRQDFRERTVRVTFVVDYPALDRWLVVKGLVVFLSVLAGFVVTKNLPLVSIAGGTLMILVGGKKPALALRKIDGTLLLFFAALFVVVGSVVKTGLPQVLYEWLAPFFNGSVMSEVTAFSLFAALASNVVSNVPFVVLASHWIPNFVDPELMWLVLAMSSTFAGNLTIVASVANMIVFELAKEEVEIGFFDFFKVGFLTTGVSLLVGVSFLSFYAFMGW